VPELPELPGAPDVTVLLAEVALGGEVAVSPQDCNNRAAKPQET
jgi:hypothetical protein